MSDDWEMPKSACPGCGYKVDHCSRPEQGVPLRKPKPGDLSLCLNCGQVNKFDAKMELVESEVEDMDDLTPQQFVLIRRAQKHIFERGPIG